MSVEVQVNIDEWLDKNNKKKYNLTLIAAVFHYSAHATKNEHFEICIGNKEMKDAAWKYAHQSQIIVDGTFRICNQNLLLFIMMGVNENKKGVPLLVLSMLECKCKAGFGELQHCYSPLADEEMEGDDGRAEWCCVHGLCHHH